jgi:hypothetical protein
MGAPRNATGAELRDCQVDERLLLRSLAPKADGPQATPYRSFRSKPILLTKTRRLSLRAARKNAPATCQNLCAEVLVTGYQRKDSRSPHGTRPLEPAWYRGSYWLACFGRRPRSAAPSGTPYFRSTAARHCHEHQAHPRRSDRRTDTRFSNRQTKYTCSASIPIYAPSC